MNLPTENERSVGVPPAVLHLIDTGGPGGAETLFSRLAAHSASMGMRPVAVVPREGWLSDHVRTHGIQPLILPSKGSLNLTYARNLIKLVRGQRVKLIHCHLLGSAVYGAIAGLLTRTPVIAVLHGPTDLRSLGRLAPVKRWLLRNGCSSLVAVSTSTRDALIRFGLAPESITLIPNGVDTAYYSPGRLTDLRTELGIPPDDPVVGAVGNIRAPKSYDVLLRAAALVLDVLPRSHFAIIGDGTEADMRPLLELRTELGIVNHCHFLGFRQGSPSLYRNFDVFVSSSSSEGLSLAFLEAMATGLPVVATRSGGPQEVIESGVSGLLVPTQDPAALAAGLVEVLKAPALRLNLGLAARERVSNSFSQELLLTRYAALYERLLGREVADQPVS